ncbi:hypothetical protein N7G274_006442 [Stereocaulon virgatum]|uniref:Transcription initiation factor IIE subunit beta n=1 Tax=Stereocaulon virgatum TaxID=373712 RepID=A0ABR4A8B4_9LECA
MSYLQNQISAFKSSVNSSAGKVANKRTAGATTNAGPSPAPSRPAGSIQNDLKRKRPEPANIVYSQPPNTGSGNSIMTNIWYITQWLKDKSTKQKRPWRTLKECVDSANIAGITPEGVRNIEKILIGHDKVKYNPKGDGGKALFSYRPFHNIQSADQLLGFLQSQPTFKGLAVRQLKDGWTESTEAIDDLELEGKLLVTRNKKDNQAKMVWPDDPTLGFIIDDEFKNIWHKIKLPEPAALADELEREGLTPANKSRAVKPKVVKQEKKTKKPRKGGKTTNVHMAGVLRDYSHLKK